MPDLVRVTPPSAVDPIVTLGQAKAHLRIDSSDDDDLVAGLLDAAVAWLDGYSGVLGRALVTQTWALHFDWCFPSWRIPLPLPPLISVDKIEWVDAAGAVQLLDPSTYVVLEGAAAAVQPAFGLAWPAPRSQPRAATITFKAGYGAAATVPAAIKAAVKLWVGHLYEHREAVVGVDNRDSSTVIPLGIAELLAPFRARGQF